MYTIQAGTVQDIVSQAQNMQAVQPYALVGQNVFFKKSVLVNRSYKLVREPLIEIA